MITKIDVTGKQVISHFRGTVQNPLIHTVTVTNLTYVDYMGITIPMHCVQSSFDDCTNHISGCRIVFLRMRLFEIIL